MEEISHAHIYERLLKVEEKVDRIDNNTKDIVEGFVAAKGAFKVLGWIADAAKPILWVSGAIASFWALITHLGNKH